MYMYAYLAKLTKLRRVVSISWTTEKNNYKVLNYTIGFSLEKYM